MTNQGVAPILSGASAVLDGNSQDAPKLPTESLTSRTLHGLKWSYASTVVNAILQIASTAILARLLDPGAYGLVAMANVVLRFGSYFSQMGIGSALVQKQELSKEEIQASFTSSLFLGLTCFVGMYLLAPFSVLIFGGADVVPVVRWMALGLLLNGLSTTALSLLRRRLQFRVLAIADIASFVIGAGLVGIPLAYLGMGVWSLVASFLGQSAVLLLIAYGSCRHPLNLSFQWASHRPLYSFGSRFSLIGFLEFLIYNLDSVLIGRFLGTNPLGTYNRASLLINLPAQSFSTSFSKVLFPSLSKIQADRVRLRKVYSTAMLFLGLGLFSFAFAISASAREVTLVVLGRRWEDTIPVLRVVALAVPFTLLLWFDGMICDVTARLNLRLLLTVIHLSLFLVLWTLFIGYGLVGFALALLIGEIVSYMLFTFIVIQILALPISDVLELHLIVMGAGLVIWLCEYLLEAILPGIGLADWLILILEMVTASACLFTLIVLRPPRRLKRELRELLLSIKIVKPLDSLRTAVLRRNQ